MEESFGLSVEIDISEILITGDFNFDMSSQPGHRKIDSLCQTYSLHQFTDHSFSLLNLILVSNKYHVIHRVISELFRPQQLRFHCLIYFFSFLKP